MHKIDKFHIAFLIIFSYYSIMNSDIIFKRKASESLNWWKNTYKGKTAALLQGPRRVGKSVIAENFAKCNYKSYILIDFSNISKELKEVFDDISNLDIFFLRLQAITSIELYERESVIIFDEIQLVPQVRQAIKHLVKDGRYDYIETGSLISIKKNVKNILIPSEETKIDVFPMDYEEFNWACNKDNEILNKIYLNNRPVGQSTNRVLMKDFRIYMAVGGMPQAVEAFIDKKSFKEIDLIKKGILDLYKEDFNKIDPTGRISLIFDSIPSQLALKRNRFIMTKAIKIRNRKYQEEYLADLVDSKAVIVCNNVKDPSIAFNLTKDFSTFKLYYCDIGLFITQLFNSQLVVDQSIYSKLLSDKLDANLGYIYENVAAQIIKSSGRELFYYSWKTPPQTHPHEIDFLISNKTKLIPIEIKSSDYRNHKSINEFSNKYSSRITRRLLFSQNDISNDNMLEMKPIYLLPCFLKYLGGNN